MASRCASSFRINAFTRPRPKNPHSRLHRTATCPSPRCLATAATETPPTKHHPSPLPLPSTTTTTTTHSDKALTSAADPKIDQLVHTISGLTLLQASDLVTLLKTRLNIQEIALPTAAAAPLQTGSGSASQEASTEPEKPKAKTIFNVTLESFEAGAKPKVIREVKALVPNLTLIEAKKFVESLPKVLKENLSKEDADKLKATFEAVGAVIKLE